MAGGGKGIACQKVDEHLDHHERRRKNIGFEKKMGLKLLRKSGHGKRVPTGRPQKPEARPLGESSKLGVAWMGDKNGAELGFLGDTRLGRRFLGWSKKERKGKNYLSRMSFYRACLKY